MSQISKATSPKMLNRNVQVFQAAFYTTMVLSVILIVVMFIPILPVLRFMSFSVTFLIMMAIFRT